MNRIIIFTLTSAFICLNHLGCIDPSESKKELMHKFDQALFKDVDLVRADSLSSYLITRDDLLAEDYHRIVILKKLLGEFGLALEIGEVGLKRSTTSSDSILILSELIEISGKLCSVAQAERFSQQILSVDSLSTWSEFATYCILGDLYFDKKMFEQALTRHQMAFDLASLSYDTTNLRWAANELCFDYAELKRFNKAWELNKTFRLERDSMITAEMNQ
jgi:tetratricopeptide (TPR) repeat protein